MKEPTKEQIKKFWEKCGLHYTVPYWLDKNDALAFYGEVYSELLRNLDLNNLFKYAVPLVLAKIGRDNLLKLVSDALCGAIRLKVKFEDTLFWAIWEVIK